jgi:group I intron endonuclease
MICIYSIINLKNNKRYIGYTVDFKHRKLRHLKDLRRNIHGNEHLQKAYNKYGGDIFVFEVLEECKKAELVSKEHKWCITFNTHNFKFGYNIYPTGEGKRKKIPKKMRKKISESLKNSNYRHPPELIQQIAEKHRGFKHTAKSIKKMSQSMMGHDVSEETRKKISESVKKTNYKHTPEQLLKMSEASRGRQRSPETIEKFRIAMLGHKVSEETRKKISDKLMGVPLDKERVLKKGKKVINTETGVVYNFIYEAAKTMGKDGSWLSQQLLGNCPNITPFIYLKDFNQQSI